MLPPRCLRAQVPGDNPACSSNRPSHHPPHLGLRLLHLHHLYHTLASSYIPFPWYPRTTHTHSRTSDCAHPSVPVARTANIIASTLRGSVVSTGTSPPSLLTAIAAGPALRLDRGIRGAFLRKIHSDPPASHTQSPIHFACASDDISYGSDHPNINPPQTSLATLLCPSSSAHPAL